MTYENEFPVELTFDDLLMLPEHSDLASRDEADIGSHLGNSSITLELPVISAPMDKVTEDRMASAMSANGGLGIIHRYNTIERQCELVKNVNGIRAAAIGASGDYLERAAELVKSGVSVLCIDIAHGDHDLMRIALETLRAKYPHIHLMAGNVATKEGFSRLSNWGADSIKVGIGSGAICSTRLQTGFGRPNAAAILDITKCSAYIKNHSKLIIDGGIRYTGDMVKAFALGADFVMCGSLLAGTEESPGEIITEMDGTHKKCYRGMASREAQNEWRGKSSAPEGISTFINFKGSVTPILQDMIGNIKSGYSYAGARNIKELRQNVRFVRQTSAGRNESFTHILNK